jgi:trehalose-phosphatase
VVAVTEALDPALREALSALASVPCLLVASDYDGTLSPIVEDPAAAVPLPEAIDALRALAALPGTDVVVVSGRGLRELSSLSGLDDDGGVRLVGSHGSEFEPGVLRSSDDGADARRAVVADAVADAVSGVAGVLVEPKPTGVAVHVRRASREDAARVLARLRSGPASLAGVTATEGKEVLELSVVESDKGEALDVVRQETGADAVLFVGDDVTDENAFRRLRNGDAGVKVGPGETLAAYRVEDPPAVALLLAALAEARASWVSGAAAGI